MQKEFEKKFGSRALFDEPLAPYLAYRVGGPADILLFPISVEELDWITRKAKEHALPVTILGSGTNLLVLDKGIRGISISLRDGFRTIERKSSIEVRCGGATEKAHLLEWSMAENLGGLEFSAGVPGTVGGGVFMNAGTKYGCYGDILTEICLYKIESGYQILKAGDFQFGYREQNAVKDSIVTEVTLKLAPKDGALIRQEVDRIILERAEKQPLEHPSCGSTFKNPKDLSAGRLIERAGLKGRASGDAIISEKHANFILNRGRARAADIMALIELVQSEVLQEFGVALEREVVVLGE